MAPRLQFVAVVVTALLLIFIFELVRRRRLMERYALLWIFAATVLLALAAWSDGLQQLAEAVGVFYAPSAFFAVAFGFVLVLLLHFSLVVSRIVEQNKVLAQQVGQLQERIERLQESVEAQGDPDQSDREEAVRGSQRPSGLPS